MNILSPSGLLKAAAFAALCLLTTLIFQVNLLNVAPQDFFDRFQQNGQARVLGGIIADARSLDKMGANFGKVYRDTEDAPPPTEDHPHEETYEIFRDYHNEEAILFEPYPVHYGLQAIAYSFLHNRLGLSELHEMQLVSSLLLAVSVVSLFFLYRGIYDNLFAFLFLIALIGSPWLVSMGRNIYWNPFLFFVPSVLAALLYLERRQVVRWLLLALIAASLLIKSLSNYEYLTTVTLLACSVFIAAPFFDRNVKSPKPDYRMAAAVFAACVLGFAIAFVIHASTRGDTLVAGLQNLFEQDVMRRTFGDASLYTHDETRESLDATPLDVLKIYLFEWPTKRLMIVPGKIFWALLVLALAGIAFKFAIRHPTRMRDLVTLVTFFSVPVSWFVFAKGHSYTQTHINFVLWYIGFMPALFYVVIQTGSAGLGWLRSNPQIIKRLRSVR